MIAPMACEAMPFLDRAWPFSRRHADMLHDVGSSLSKADVSAVCRQTLMGRLQIMSANGFSEEEMANFISDIRDVLRANDVSLMAPHDLASLAPASKWSPSMVPTTPSTCAPTEKADLSVDDSHSSAPSIPTMDGVDGE